MWILASVSVVIAVLIAYWLWTDSDTVSEFEPGQMVMIAHDVRYAGALLVVSGQMLRLCSRIEMIRGGPCWSGYIDGDPTRHVFPVPEWSFERRDCGQKVSSQVAG